MPALVACAQGGDGQGKEAGAAPSSSPLGPKDPWSRESREKSPSSSPAGANDAGPTQEAPLDPTALDELIAAVPKEPVPATGEDGGTAVGTDTGIKPGSAHDKNDKTDAKQPPAASAKAAQAAPPNPQVSFGPLSIQAEMSSASIEREARAQLYWSLVQRCRAKDGSILPPDVVTLVFRIDEDGYIVGSSILATPSKAIYDDAAHCMRRELSAATFRAPVGARGMPTTVTMTVPSVD
jgi:hypothetical protein